MGIVEKATCSFSIDYPLLEGADLFERPRLIRRNRMVSGSEAGQLTF